MGIFLFLLFNAALFIFVCLGMAQAVTDLNKSLEQTNDSKEEY